MSIRKIGGFFKSVYTEVGKVVWPTRNKVKKDTIVVIATCTLLSLMYWGVNSGVLALLKVALGKAL